MNSRLQAGVKRMAELTEIRRPDMDIEADIHSMIAHYPPLQQDRLQFKVDVESGVVHFTGHVKSRISRTYLIERTRDIRGVRGVDYEQLFDEESIRLEVGRHIPTGVIANPEYGTLVLTGTPPEGVDEQRIVAAVAQIPGVRQVVTQFSAE